MRIFVVLLFIISFGFSQDFDMMEKHLDKVKSRINFTTFYEDDSSFTVRYYEEENYDCRPNQRFKLIDDFWLIYYEEYLRYVAREMLKEQFEENILIPYKDLFFFNNDSLGIDLK